MSVDNTRYNYRKQRWCKLFYTLSFFDTNKLKWRYVREKRNGNIEFTLHREKALVFDTKDDARRYSYKVNAPKKLYIHDYFENWLTIQQIRNMKRGIDYGKQFQ